MASLNAIDVLATYDLTSNGNIGYGPGLINGGRGPFWDGATGYFSNSSMTFGNQSWSVACWLYIRTGQTDPYSLGIKNGEWSASLSNYLGMNVTTDGGGNGNGDFGQHVVYDAWNLAVYGVNISTAKYYSSLNGASPINFAYSGTTPVTNGNPVKFFEGQLGNGTGDFPGYVDEMAVWHKMISNSEITQIYNSGAGLAYESYDAGLLTSLIAYYKMNESLPSRPTIADRPGIPARLGNRIVKVF